MWITNGSVADVAVVWAQSDDGIRGFVVPTDSPGFSAPLTKHKMSLRASVTSELILDGVRVPAEAALPEVRGLKGPLSCLNEARYGIVWGAMGAARSSLLAAQSYAAERTQFGKPIASYQLTQQKLVDMALEYAKGVLLALHLGRRKDAGTLRPEQVSMGKLNNVREALEICRTARGILGAQRDLAGVPRNPAHEQPGVGPHLRGHGRDAHPGRRPGDHGPVWTPTTTTCSPSPRCSDSA